MPHPLRRDGAGGGLTCGGFELPRRSHPRRRSIDRRREGEREHRGFDRGPFVGQSLPSNGGHRRVTVSSVRVPFHGRHQQRCAVTGTDEYQRASGRPYPEVAGSNPAPATAESRDSHVGPHILWGPSAFRGSAGAGSGARPAAPTVERAALQLRRGPRGDRYTPVRTAGTLPRTPCSVRASRHVAHTRPRMPCTPQRTPRRTPW